METNYDPYEVGWVAGLIDGEGSIVLVPSYHKRKLDGKTPVSARVMVAVCDFSILEKYTQILHKWGIAFGHSLQHYDPSHGQYSTWHDKIMIQIWKQDSIVKLLEIITPHLTLKRGVAEHVIDFARWRFSHHLKVVKGKIINPEILVEEEYYSTKYQQAYKGKARSHIRPLSETIRVNSMPLRWQD
jgi:hypothetical protein